MSFTGSMRYPTTCRSVTLTNSGVHALAALSCLQSIERICRVSARAQRLRDSAQCTNRLSAPHELNRTPESISATMCPTFGFLFRTPRQMNGSPDARCSTPVVSLPARHDPDRVRASVQFRSSHWSRTRHFARAARAQAGGRPDSARAWRGRLRRGLDGRLSAGRRGACLPRAGRRAEPLTPSAARPSDRAPAQRMRRSCASGSPLHCGG